MATRVDVAGIQQLERRLSRVREELRVRVAAGVAREYTRLMRQAYDAGQQVDGSPRPLGVRGNRLTLVRTGETRRGLRYTSNQGRVTVRLAGAAPYLLKYGILPLRSLPRNWTLAAAKIVRLEAIELMRGRV